MTEEQGSQLISELQSLAVHQAGAKAAQEVTNAFLGACLALLIFVAILQFARTVRR